MGLSNPSYFITTKNKKNMENAIIVPFDLNTARKIKSGEIEGSVLIDNIEIEFVYESKDCAGPYNLLFVKKDGYGISAIYANTEMKNILLKISQKRILDGIGEDIPYQKNPLIK